MPGHLEPLGILVDRTIDFSSDEGFLPYEPGEFETLEDLLELLHAEARREAHVLHLDIPGNLRALLAIGGELGAISVCPLVYPDRNWKPIRARMWTAQSHKLYATQARLFRELEDQMEVSVAELMPVEEVIQLAAHFAKYRELAETHQWFDEEGVAFKLTASTTLYQSLLCPPGTQYDATGSSS